MRDSGLFDAGDVTLYKVSSTEQSAVPGRWTLAELATLPFQERVVGYQHFFAAQAARQSVDRTVRIEHYPEIAAEISVTGTIADISGIFYRIVKITPTKDDDEIPVIDLDLTNDDFVIRRKLAPEKEAPP